MRNIKIFVVLLFVLSSSAFGQIKTLNDLFDHYNDSEGITSIQIGKPMFDMIKNMDLGDDRLDDIQPILENIKSIKMLIIEEPELTKDSLIDAELIKRNLFIKSQINSAVNRLRYEDLLTVNSDGNKVKILSKDVDSNMVENVLLNIDSDDSTVLIMLDGLLNMDDLSTIINESDED